MPRFVMHHDATHATEFQNHILTPRMRFWWYWKLVVATHFDRPFRIISYRGRVGHRALPC